MTATTDVAEPVAEVEGVDVEDPLAEYREARRQMRVALDREERAVAKARLAELRAMDAATLRLRAKAIREKLRRIQYEWACDLVHCNGLPHDGMWHRHARSEQRPPAGAWLVWAIISGRGFGKTRTGAETTGQWGLDRPLHIAVIGENFTKVRDLCFEHPKSGLLAVIPPEEVASYTRALGNTVLVLKNGTVFRGLSAEKPDQPRGYAFDKAWYDEYGAWPAKLAEEVHPNVLFALREADDARIVITTTPRPLPHVKAVVEAGQKPGSRTVLTRGHMRDNAANLGEEILATLEAIYTGTRLGRQELAGELLDDVEGALWQLWMFEEEGFRLAHNELPDLARVVVGMDPAASDSEAADSTGLVVIGKTGLRDVTYGDRRPHGYVLDVKEVRGLPETRCHEAAKLFRLHKADAVIVEENKGGDWIPAVFRQVEPEVPVRTVNATRGKITRAEPVSALYESHRMHHVGPKGQQDPEGHRVAFAKLEDQMTTWKQGDPDSPDLMDALVWAATELFVDTMPHADSRKVTDRRLAGRR